MMRVQEVEAEKKAVQEFWEKASCGEELFLPSSRDRDGYKEHARRRYELEPYIVGFADFPSSAGREVLEIGVGLGADHQRFAEAGAKLTGVDLTERAVSHVRRRLGLFGLTSTLSTGDAENLRFKPSISISCIPHARRFVGIRGRTASRRRVAVTREATLAARIIALGRARVGSLHVDYCGEMIDDAHPILKGRN
jgi:SAM-dependent methyltransferase